MTIRPATPRDCLAIAELVVELELCVPESFYVNMLAAYPRFRGQGHGSSLMAEVDRQALAAGCELISIAVFAINQGALRLYQRLGYEIVERRPMIASDYVPAGDVLLLTREASLIRPSTVTSVDAARSAESCTDLC